MKLTAILLGLLLLVAPALFSCSCIQVQKEPDIKISGDTLAKIEKFKQRPDGTYIVPPWIKEQEEAEADVFHENDLGPNLLPVPTTREPKLWRM